MKKEDALAIEHKKFRDYYRASNSGDWQTYQLGLDAGWEAAKIHLGINPVESYDSSAFIKTEQDYVIRLKQIEVDFHNAKQELFKAYAMNNEIYKRGDIISAGDKTILIDTIGAYTGLGLPGPVYRGASLTKNLTPKKNGDRESIYGNEYTKLIKSA